MKNSILLVALSLFVFAPSFGETNFDVVGACKSECPKAKTNDEAHKCAEKKGRLNKEFKKSKCWDVNEQYEAAQAKEKGTSEGSEK